MKWNTSLAMLFLGYVCLFCMVKFFKLSLSQTCPHLNTSQSLAYQNHSSFKLLCQNGEMFYSEEEEKRNCLYLRWYTGQKGKSGATITFPIKIASSSRGIFMIHKTLWIV